MGTNYYFQYHTETGRAKDLHIGKNSYGWEFGFRGYKGEWEDREIKSFADWKNLFKEREGQIFDEYDQPISVKELLALIESSSMGKRKDDASIKKPLNHTIYCREHHPEHAERDCWLDEDGWSFCGTEFS